MLETNIMEGRSIGADAIVGSGSSQISYFWTQKSYKKEPSISFFFCSVSCTVFLSLQSRVLRVLEHFYCPSLMLLVKHACNGCFTAPPASHTGVAGIAHTLRCSRRSTPQSREKEVYAERQVLLLKEVLLLSGCQESQGLVQCGQAAETSAWHSRFEHPPGQAWSALWQRQPTGSAGSHPAAGILWCCDAPSLATLTAGHKRECRRRGGVVQQQSQERLPGTAVKQ